MTSNGEAKDYDPCVSVSNRVVFSFPEYPKLISAAVDPRVEIDMMCQRKLQRELDDANKKLAAQAALKFMVGP